MENGKAKTILQFCKVESLRCGASAVLFHGGR